MGRLRRSLGSYFARQREIWVPAPVASAASASFRTVAKVGPPMAATFRYVKDSLLRTYRAQILGAVLVGIAGGEMLAQLFFQSIPGGAKQSVADMIHMPTSLPSAAPVQEVFAAATERVKKARVVYPTFEPRKIIEHEWNPQTKAPLPADDRWYKLGAPKGAIVGVHPMWMTAAPPETTRKPTLREWYDEQQRKGKGPATVSGTVAPPAS